MKIIDACGIEVYEAAKRRDRNINNFSSAYLAAAYLMLIVFICLVGGSIINLVEVIT